MKFLYYIIDDGADITGTNSEEQARNYANSVGVVIDTAKGAVIYSNDETSDIPEAALIDESGCEPEEEEDEELE